MILLCKKCIVSKYKEMKSMSKSSKKGYGSKRALLPMMMMVVMMMMMITLTMMTYFV
jgi:hypothetical protein